MNNLVANEEETYKASKRIVENQIKEKKWTFTARDVQIKLKMNYHINIPIHEVRKIMKERLNLSFKRINSRPSNIWLNKLRIWRILFWIKFTKLITNDTLLINIDEWTISNKTKLNYSWSQKGKSWEVQNSNFSSSWSIIMAILNTGQWYCLILWSTVNSEIFSTFISYLNKWILGNNMFGKKNVSIILDNCSSHRSSASKNTIISNNITIIYLPTYSPQFAPVELIFNIFKKNLLSQTINNWMKLDRIETFNAIKWALDKINAQLQVDLDTSIK